MRSHARPTPRLRPTAAALLAVAAGDLFRGFGWAQMASHGDLVLRLAARARGRTA